MFDTTKTDLRYLVKLIDEGKLQLPDFQRDYVWNDDDVRSLIASIAKGFPIGALLTLESGGEVNFKPRLLAGVPVKQVEPEELLLDGQQRMTSLYLSLYSKVPVRTRTRQRKEIDRFYYLDIKKAIINHADIEDAIIGVPADKIQRTDFGREVVFDLSSADCEYEQDMFPLNLVFDSKNWFYGWHDYWKEQSRDISELEKKFDLNVLDMIQHYKMPIIRLDKKNTREAICLVFEKVNVGGKKLDAFELLTAIYAASKFDLREDWKGSPSDRNPGRKARMVDAENPRRVLKNIASTDFLQACTLLHTREERIARAKEGAKDKELSRISCNRQALLGLPLSAYKKYADAVEQGFVEAAAYLNEIKIIAPYDVPYPPQIVTLAATFALLGKDSRSITARNKLSLWFYSVSLGELYGSSTEFRLARDVMELEEWIKNDGKQPRSLADAIFQQDRLRTLRSRNAAAYKAIHTLLMRSGCCDFITGKTTELMTFFNDRIDIHHIFPQAWCKKHDIKQGRFNSIVNKTPLSKLSNIIIGGDAPSVYLKKVEKKNDIASDQLDNILRTHLIDPDSLRADDFDVFFEKRIEALSDLVAKAMNKPVVKEHGTNEPEEDIEFDHDMNHDLELVSSDI